MNKRNFAACLLSFGVLLVYCQKIVPVLERVTEQEEIAPLSSIIDGEWIAVGKKAAHAIGKDYSLLFEGKPSYRFELKSEDNTLEGYSAGETKGRAELSYCFATADDIKGLTSKQFSNAVAAKKVYFYGKGSCKQASERYYKFSVYIPLAFPKEVNTIFAQWHGMPDRTLLKTPEGIIRQVSDDEFAELAKKIVFKKDTGYDKIMLKNSDGTRKLDANGKQKYKIDSKPNGWLVEQGGYPPLAFGFSNQYFYIKANSDSKWLTDKTDRCNTEPEKATVLVPRKSDYKACTIACKMPFADFPKGQWVTFDVKVIWTAYGKEKENILKPGQLDVRMAYLKNEKPVSDHIVNNVPILIGRNDDMGYYFKFGIYRVGNSTTPVNYNLAGYREGATLDELK